ncbi:MAG: DUF2791 family P-loop domain-containing protein [Clostridiales bacterium]|nr:DUF2791 family P-loop domain-containing protein [Clostridiales bacterium]
MSKYDLTQQSKEPVIPRRILSALLSSLSAGVVPRSGAPYIAIGRHREIAALLSDLETVSQNGSAIRFIIGRYGSGKSFLIQLIRGYAIDRDFICADADLSPERRLYGSNGTGLATYRELIKNLSSKASPDGGALPKIIARWLSTLQSELVEEGLSPEEPAFDRSLSTRIHKTVRTFESGVGGFDFAAVLTQYFKASMSGDDAKRSACLRWLRGEFSNKTEARAALGFNVGGVINDDNWYDYIKLWALFARIAGYRGFVVFIDECVNLYKITNRISRENNYEKLLSMYNNTLGGRAEGLMMVFGGTPQFLEDTRRGLFGYEALRSRLCDTQFASGSFIDFSGPIIRLRRLSNDELLALISRLTKLHAKLYPNGEGRVTEENMIAFMNLCLSRTSSSELITPREIIRDYLSVLNILVQNDNISFDDIVTPSVEQKTDEKPTSADISLEDIDF